MATKKSQRIGIWVIAGVMLMGTIGGFIAMMVQPGNEAKDQAALRKAQDEYKKATSEYQKKVDAQAAELSGAHYATFSQYMTRVAAFTPDDIKELKTEDLVIGEGAEVGNDTKFAAYYIGWNPKGEVFDQSIEDGKLKAPIMIDGLAGSSVIAGWKEGLIGMKVGGVRELTIPSDKAYGDKSQGDKIPANTPLKFVVMAIDRPVDIPEPQIPDTLKKWYKEVHGISL